MRELIDMINVRGNITSDEERKIAAKKKPAASKTRASKTRDRIDDGRARLQRIILDYMQVHSDQWHTCAGLASAIRHRAQNVTYAMRRLESKGKVICTMQTIPVLNKGGAYYMRKIKHFAVSDGASK